MHLDRLLSENVRNNLRTQMHKVAAVMAQQQHGLQLPDGAQEITLKTAAYLIGLQAFKLRREKQAMLDGILNLAQL